MQKKTYIVLNWLEMIFCNQLIIYGYWLEGRNEQHYFLIVFWSWQVPSSATIPSNRKSQLKCIACYSSPTYIFSQLLHISCVYIHHIYYIASHYLLSCNHSKPKWIICFTIVHQIREAYLLFQVKLIFI